MGELGRTQFTIPDSRYKCCDLESRRRLIRFTTPVAVKSPQNEIPSSLKVPATGPVVTGHSGEVSTPTSFGLAEASEDSCQLLQLSKSRDRYYAKPLRVS
jgi:hypothetical protein